MSSKAMKAIFDNLTSGTSRRAELEYSVDSAVHHEANSIKVSVKSMRLSTQMQVMDWAKAKCEDTETAMDWCTSIKRNWSHGQNSWPSSSPGYGPRTILQREEAYCRMLISSPYLEDCYTTGTSLSTKSKK